MKFTLPTSPNGMLVLNLDCQPCMSNPTTGLDFVESSKGMNEMHTDSICDLFMDMSSKSYHHADYRRGGRLRRSGRVVPRIAKDTRGQKPSFTSSRPGTMLIDCGYPSKP